LPKECRPVEIHKDGSEYLCAISCGKCSLQGLHYQLMLVWFVQQPRAAGISAVDTAPHRLVPALSTRARKRRGSGDCFPFCRSAGASYSVVREVGIRLRDTGAVGSCVELNALRCKPFYFKRVCFGLSPACAGARVASWEFSNLADVLAWNI
jgi:hypothetical protein